MADIRRIGPFRHLRAEASSHVLHYRRAALRRAGRGLAFWFSPYAASIAEIPVDDRELVLLFRGRTSDFQDVSVEGVMTYRVSDPTLLSERIDFTIDLANGRHRRQPLDALALMLSQLAQQHAAGAIATTSLRDLLVVGPPHLREVVERGLAADPALGGFGLAIVSVRVSGVRPVPEVERALETPTREKIQEEADRAAFARRAMAVEHERAIQQNELGTKLDLSRREESLIEQQGKNQRSKAADQAAQLRITAEGAAERARIEAAARAEAARLEGDAEAARVAAVEGAHAAAERARLEAYRDLPAAALLGVAARELAGKLPNIEHLHVSSAGLAPLLEELVGNASRRLEGRAAP